MSKYGEYLNSVKENQIARFFGETSYRSNKYFKFNHIVDEDTIIVITENVTVVKDSFVLIVGKNQAIYLKDWQVADVHNYDDGFNGYAVKLNRKFMKVYTFKSDFEGYAFGDRVDDFDSFAEVAASQNDYYIALGHMDEE